MLCDSPSKVTPPGACEKGETFRGLVGNIQGWPCAGRPRRKLLALQTNEDEPRPSRLLAEHPWSALWSLLPGAARKGVQQKEGVMTSPHPRQGAPCLGRAGCGSAHPQTAGP